MRKLIRKLIKEALIKEAKLSKSEKDKIRLEVEIELGEEFELIASQAKDLEEYERLEAMFKVNVDHEANRRIRTAELEALGFPEPKPVKVKIDDKSAWNASWRELDRQELATTRKQPQRREHPESPTIDVTPGFDGDNSHLNPAGPVLSKAEMNRRDFIKSVLAGTAVAGSAGVFDPILGDTNALSDTGLESLEIEEAISHWLDWFIASGQLDEAYNYYILNKEWLEMFGQGSLEGNSDKVVEYIMEFMPDLLFEPMGSYYEKHGYLDPWEFEGAIDENGNEVYPKGTSRRLDDMIKKKLKDYYTPGKVKEIMRSHKAPLKK
jgi:hypothetical protein